MFVRKKANVVVEARQYTGTNGDELQQWSGGKAGQLAEVEDAVSGLQMARSLYCHSLEGRVTGKVGDWIIRGVSGEFYIIDDVIFQNTYEEVTEVA